MDFKEYLKELSIVILGILIAFWISNIGMNYKERTIQKQVLLTILNELKENNENLNASRLELDTLCANLIRIQNMNNSPASVTINYAGISLKCIGYETAKNTGILKDVNYKLTSKIVENYEAQNSLKESEKLMINEIFLLMKNKIVKGDKVDYLLIQLMNLMNNLKSFDTEQKQLIENLMVFLEKKS